MIVWYLNHYASFPESGFPGRPYHIGRSFADHGHEAIVVRASYHHLADQSASAGEIGRVSIHDDIKYYCIDSRHYTGKGFVRLLNTMDYSRGVAGLARKVTTQALPKPEIIISSCPHLFAYPAAHKLAKRFAIPLVYEVRDLWPVTLVGALHLNKFNPVIVWMEQIEKRAYRTCQAVVSVLPNTLPHMEQKGLAPYKFNHIPNGVSRREWDAAPEPLPPDCQTEFDRIKATGKLVVVYAGAHGLPNALDQILDLQRLNQENRPFHFILIGDGVSKTALQKRVRDEHIDFVSFLPRLRKRQVRTALVQADVCFIGWRPASVYRFGISPNKVGDYFMAAKPIIHAVKAGNDPVQEAQGGISVEPFNPEQLDNALRTFATMTPEEREQIGRRGRQYALEHLDWSILGDQYVQLCERLSTDHR